MSLRLINRKAVARAAVLGGVVLVQVHRRGNGLTIGDYCIYMFVQMTR